MQLAVCIHVGIAASGFRRPGDNLAAGQVVRVERLHAVAAVNGQAAAGKRNPCPLASQLYQLPDGLGELRLIGPQPAGKVRIQLGHGVVGDYFINHACAGYFPHKPLIIWLFAIIYADFCFCATVIHPVQRKHIAFCNKIVILRKVFDLYFVCACASNREFLA